MGWPLIAGLFILSGGAVGYMMRMQQKAAKKAANAMGGVLDNKESNVEPLPVIYGERRVGGVRVFVKSKNAGKPGTPWNEQLFVCFVLSEGEVESITDILIDDLPITDKVVNCR